MIYDLLFLFYNFLHILPPELFGLLWPRTVPFSKHSKFFCEGKASNLKCYLGFEKFQIVAHGFLGCQFLEKYRIFHFGQFLIHQLKFQGVMQ